MKKLFIFILGVLAFVSAVGFGAFCAMTSAGLNLGNTVNNYNYYGNESLDSIKDPDDFDNNEC